ncbi:hypothetical protein D8674_026559 [Pyrus ussuriensis x Pyrus communis]|uniref:DUF936 domain-containing protein n=1 Tax=Pyrus ussuriensis x Pyrus communis TaxID=2448454 RepID=A0A5N5I760_9ROSA|nr:hypothetical protein D8674_026559 [Pyrus ussuriensis x Pyrus communis]
MVFCNQLLLGQLIFVEKLEAAHPVPMLKVIRPLSSRFPCVGNPEDLSAIDKLVDSRGASDLAMEKSRDVEKKPQCRYRSFIPSKEMCVVTKGFTELSSSFVEKDSDPDCTSTLSSSSSILPHEMKPIAHRSHSACVRVSLFLLPLVEMILCLAFWKFDN